MKKVFICLILFLLTGCIREPISPYSNETFDLNNEYSLTLCEGLYGYNNSSLTLCDLETGKSNLNFFENCNKYPLGDIANDMIIKGQYLYIVMSSSKTVYKIDLKSGLVLSKINFNSDNFPRKLILISDSIGYLTEAYSNSILELNLNEMRIERTLEVGPQPEGIGYFQGKLYIANSGWGDVNKNAPGASTVSIIDINSMSEITRFPTGKDPVEIQIDPYKQFLYVLYYNLPSLKDSLGGIIQYNLNNFNKINEWRGNFSNMQLTSTGDSIFVVKGGYQKKVDNYLNSIYLIDLKHSETKEIFENKNNKVNWYNFQVDYLRGQIWIADAKNFQSNGEVLIYDLNSKQLIKKFQTGVNPSKIIFKNR